MINRKLQVTIWNENIHERTLPKVAAIYPQGIHGAIAEIFAANPDFDVKTATLDQPEQGLPAVILECTDVLIWWGHMAHDQVADDLVDRVCQRVLNGMGLIVLHSAMQSKIFKRLMGTSCEIKWREVGEKERVWIVDRSHPIVRGLNECFEIPHAEMYGEPFEIPAPEELVSISWFAGGEVFRSGCCFRRGAGRIFYFSPGHEEYPIYYQDEVRTVIRNAVQWAVPVYGPSPVWGNVQALENIK